MVICSLIYISLLLPAKLYKPDIENIAFSPPIG
jgi:hypothetical protein